MREKKYCGPVPEKASTANQMPATTVEISAMKYVVRRLFGPTNVSISHATTIAAITSASGNKAVIGAFCMIFKFLRFALLRQRQLRLRNVGQKVLHRHVHYFGKGLRIDAHVQRQRGEHGQHEELAA